MERIDPDRDAMFGQARAALDLAAWSVGALHAQLEIAGIRTDTRGRAFVPKALLDLERRHGALADAWKALQDIGGDAPASWRRFVALGRNFRDAEQHAYLKLVREELRQSVERSLKAAKPAAAAPIGGAVVVHTTGESS